MLRGQRCFRWAASQVMPSMSRWLVGSSRAITSHSPTSSPANCTRRRCPPLSVATVCVPGDVGHQPPDHVADPRVARPPVLGLVADQRPAHGGAGVEGVRLAQRRADPKPAATGDPAGVGLQLAGQQAQQAGLAVPASSPDNADARAVVDSPACTD